MNVRSIYKLSGLFSVIIGIMAFICIFRIQWLYYGVIFAILGILLGCVNVFLNAKYFSEEEKMPKGLLGIFLSSLPIIFLMLVIFKFKK
jgi:hypothetical protein